MKKITKKQKKKILWIAILIIMGVVVILNYVGIINLSELFTSVPLEPAGSSGFGGGGFG
jgi:hypothetical protein